MKRKSIVLLLILIAMLPMVSCGKAGKAVEAAQNVFKKAPKKSAAITGSALRQSGRCADDAASVADEASKDDSYSSDSYSSDSYSSEDNDY